MKPTELLHYLEGELTAQTALLHALIATHPNRQQLAEHFEAQLQGALAADVPAPVHEAALEGLQAQGELLRRLLATRP